MLRKKFSTSLSSSVLTNALKPREVVEELNKHIVGQSDAKKAVAIALRNRWRRHQLSDDLKNEVIPKNILMIGPTGCGKTEIARRIAKLSQAPFIKVEATKFTEVGFHGKDVDQIIRDLLDVSINMTKKRIKETLAPTASSNVERIIVESLIGEGQDEEVYSQKVEAYRSKALDADLVDVEIPSKSMPNGGGDRGGMPEHITAAIFESLQKVSPDRSNRIKVERRKITVAEARELLLEHELERLVSEVDVKKEAIASVEQNGIVFIDEIDKIVSSGDYRGADASSEGVQRDLLPIIEGSTISTKHGNVNTDFILFIASGAFHSAKPSDLLAELQGRLPIRVNLKGLTEDDMYRILTEPVSNLIRQQVEMMKAEDLSLSFTDDAIREIARVAFEVNKSVENIGARRLHTVIERIIEEISFDAPEKAGESYTVTPEYVRERVSPMLLASDMQTILNLNLKVRM